MCRSNELRAVKWAQIGQHDVRLLQNRCVTNANGKHAGAFNRFDTGNRILDANTGLRRQVQLLGGFEENFRIGFAAFLSKAGSTTVSNKSATPVRAKIIGVLLAEASAISAQQRARRAALRARRTTNPLGSCAKSAQRIHGFFGFALFCPPTFDIAMRQHAIERVHASHAFEGFVKFVVDVKSPSGWPAAPGLVVKYGGVGNDTVQIENKCLDLHIGILMGCFTGLHNGQTDWFCE